MDYKMLFKAAPTTFFLKIECYGYDVLCFSKITLLLRINISTFEERLKK